MAVNTSEAVLEPGAAPSSAVLPLRTKLLLTLGEGVQGIWITIGGYYLNTYLLEICCVEPASVGIIQLIVGLFDAINDSVIGMLSDRTRTRWGRRRPWLLFGAPCLSVSYFWLWNALPADTHPGLKFAYYLAAYMGVSVGLTSIAVQVAALVPELTSDYNERTVLGGFRVLGGNLIGMIFAVLHTVIVGAFSPVEGFRISAALCASCILIFSWTVFFGVREGPVAASQKTIPGLGSAVTEMRSVFGNTAFRYVTLIYLCGPTAVTMVQSNIVMFCKYVLQDEGVIMVVLPVVQGTALFMIPVWVLLSKRSSKRHIYWLGGSVLALALVSLNFCTTATGGVIVGIVVGLALAVPYLVPVSMLPDVVEDDEERTGKRREGVFAGLFTTALKLSATLALTFTNLVLQGAGYENPVSTCGVGVSGSPLEPDVQPESVLLVIRCLVGPVPAVFVLFAIFFAWRFPITPEVHAQRVASHAQKLDRVEMAEKEEPPEPSGCPSAPVSLAAESKLSL